jgi:predicted PurR-regulated permease PerM
MNFPPPTERQARVIWLAITGLAIATLVTLLAALIWGLGRALDLLAPVIWPVAVAGVVAYLLDPVVDWLEHHKVPRTRAIVTVFCLAGAVVLGFIGSIVPYLVVETRELVNEIPAYTERLQKQAEHWIDNPPEIVQKLLTQKSKPGTESVTSTTTNAAVAGPVDVHAPTNAVVAVVQPQSAATEMTPTTSVLESATTWLAKALPVAGLWISRGASYVASWFGILAGLALIPIYAFYFLDEKHGIKSKWTDYLPVTDSHFKDELVFVLESINNYLIAFFRGQVLVAISDGILYGLGFLLIGLRYGILIGAMAMVLTMIPFLGAIVTCLSALVLAIVQFGDWKHPLLVLVVFAIVQTLEGVVISPKIMGDRVGLHPVTIIIAVMAGTTLLGGILGGILAIPLTAALRVIMFRYVWRRNAAAKGDSSSTSASARQVPDK